MAATASLRAADRPYTHRTHTEQLLPAQRCRRTVRAAPERRSGLAAAFYSELASKRSGRPSCTAASSEGNSAFFPSLQMTFNAVTSLYVRGSTGNASPSRGAPLSLPGHTPPGEDPGAAPLLAGARPRLQPPLRQTKTAARRRYRRSPPPTLGRPALRRRPASLRRPRPLPRDPQVRPAAAPAPTPAAPHSLAHPPGAPPAAHLAAGPAGRTTAHPRGSRTPPPGCRPASRPSLADRAQRSPRAGRRRGRASRLPLLALKAASGHCRTFPDFAEPLPLLVGLCGAAGDNVARYSRPPTVGPRFKHYALTSSAESQWGAARRVDRKERRPTRKRTHGRRPMKEKEGLALASRPSSSVPLRSLRAEEVGRCPRKGRWRQGSRRSRRSRRGAAAVGGFRCGRGGGAPGSVGSPRGAL